MMIRRLSTGSSLQGLVLPFALLILAQASLAIFSSYSLSAVRAYVRGESLWSRHTQDAVYYLSRYARTNAQEDYRRYRDAIDVPLGDLAARNALDEPVPDLAKARDGFLRGGNAREDVPAIIWLYRNFRNFPYLKRPVDFWRETDAPVRDLVDAGTRFHLALAGNKPVSQDVRDRFRDQVHNINLRLTPKAVAFSASLSDGSRAIATRLIRLNAIAAIFLVLLMFLHTRRLVRQRQAFEMALKEEKERAEVILASIGDAVISADALGQVDYVNPAAMTLISQASDAVLGAAVGTLFGLADRDGASGPISLERALDGREAGSPPQRLIRHDGSSVPVSIQASPIGSGNPNAGAVYVIHDRTAEENFIARLSWQATHDALTGLTNRRGFEARLTVAIDTLAERRTMYGLMFLDIDQFKIINDTNGHAAGDQLLKRVATVLQRELRRDDVLARMGGDEFAILVEERDLENLASLADRLREVVESADFQWAGQNCRVTASIGVVPVADPDITLEEVLRVADVACYIAKENGRNRVEVHRTGDGELQKRFGEMGWVQKIRRAIEGDRFLLYAQEIRALSQESAGLHVELLLRLREEGGEIVLPGRFLPAAERYGLMPMIDRWVVRAAFRTIAAHIGHDLSRPISTCGINLSGASFSDAAFIRFIREQFDHYAIPPSMICFEITETSAITNLASARRFMEELRDLGCRFALDDFGNGMSSLAYLKQLPVDCIKIDGAFVRDILDDHIDRAMVEMIARVGKMTGRSTVAEFVENEAVITLLREIGIDYAQGYAIGRPRPFELLRPVLRQANTTAL